MRVVANVYFVVGFDLVPVAFWNPTFTRSRRKRDSDPLDWLVGDSSDMEMPTVVCQKRLPLSIVPKATRPPHASQ